MTVSYSNDVATSNTLTFLKLLLRWKASVYKLLWKDLLFLIIAFYIIRITYVYIPEKNQKQFEEFFLYCEKYNEAIPLSFVLGFFVSTVMTRWWNQFQNIPKPYSLGVLVSSSLQGYDEVGRAMRRTIMRYACLSLTLVFRVLSPRVQSRFPCLNDLERAGLLLQEEKTILEEVEHKFPGYSKSWLPIIWSANIVTQARREGRIRNDYTANTIIQQLNTFRSECTKLMSYHSVQIPLVYVQVVTIVVYCYFIAGVFADQINRSGYIGFNSFDAHPILLSLEFIFYMGWLKVAEELLNPFGMDDDDFDLNSLIDRNILMGYLIVDDMHNEHPLLLKDLYWSEIPKTLPDRTFGIFPEQDELDADIVNYDVAERKSVFGKLSVAIKKRRKNDIEKGQEEKAVKFSDRASLIPDANVICDIYKNIPNVEEEQMALNEELARHRRMSKDSLNKEQQL